MQNNVEVNGNSIESERTLTGTVLHWVKSYGFIRSEDPDLPHILIHYKDIETKYPRDFKTLCKGDEVVFKLQPVIKKDGTQGYHAKQLRVIEGSRRAQNERRFQGKKRSRPYGRKTDQHFKTTDHRNYH